MGKPASPKGSQADRFKEAAREIGADETGEAFERAFKKIVPPKPSVADDKPETKKPGR